MKKCNVLLGEVNSLNARHIKRLNKKLEEHNPPYIKRKIHKSLDYWKNTDEKYEISLEEV